MNITSTLPYQVPGGEGGGDISSVLDPDPQHWKLLAKKSKN
jgi:hypothetical protein